MTMKRTLSSGTEKREKEKEKANGLCVYLLFIYIHESNKRSKLLNENTIYLCVCTQVCIDIYLNWHYDMDVYIHATSQLK